MAQKSNGRRFSSAILVTLVILAAVGGAVLTLIVGAIAIQAGAFTDRKTTSARCPCDDAETTAEGGGSAPPVDQENELRRAFLAALAQNPRCDDPPAVQPDAPTPSELLVEDQEGLEMPSLEELAEQEQVEVASLQGELDQEAVDPTWAPATELETERAIAAVESIVLEDVTCGESLCRVRVTHRDLARRDEDVEKLLGTMRAGGQARVYAPSDDPTTVMYFSREGKQLSVMTPSVPWAPMPPPAPGAGHTQLPPEVPD